MKKYLKKISDPKIVGAFSKSGLGLAAVLLIVGCSDSGQNSASSGISEAAKKGVTVTIEKQSDGSYKILDEVPSAQTRVILRENGTERILSQAEIDALIAKENAAIEAGTSELTNPTGGGLGLGGTILASAAGAILGSWIGNKLFNNSNYQAQQKASYKTPQAYERSQNSFKQNAAKAGTSAASGRSGFYSPNNTGSTQNRSSTSRSTSSYGG